MALNLAVEAVRRLLKEDRTDENSAVGVKSCQALQLSVQQLLESVEQSRSSESSNGDQRELPDLLCTCFSAATNILTICKEVEAGPVWLFQELSSHLSPLFKSTFTLIKVSTELLERVTLSCDTFESVMSNLRQLCSPVLNFDPSLPVLVWRGVAKIVCRARGVACASWTIQPIISDLCIAMAMKAVECVKSAPHKDKGSEATGDGVSGEGVSYVKLLKLCRFLSSLLAKLVQEFREYSPQFAEDVAELLVELYRSVPPSPYCSPVDVHTQAKIDSNILLVCEPVFTSLLGCSQFFQSLLSLSPDEREGFWFGRLLCLSLLLKHFSKLSEGIQDTLMGPVSAREEQSNTCQLLDSLFSAVKLCSVELQLPVKVAGVMCNGQPQKAVTLYEHVLTHLCCLTACLPHHLFPRLEAVMFHHALCNDDNDSLSALLAMDTLIFIARIEERIADRYTNLLAKLLLQWSLSTHTHTMTCALLCQTHPLLSPHHQSLFTESHPPSTPTNLPLWAQLDLSLVAESAQNQIAQQLWDCSVGELAGELQSEQPLLPSIHWSLLCMNSAHSHLTSSHTPTLTSSHTPTLTTLTTQTWDWISKQELNDKWKTAIMCDIISIMADHICDIPPLILLKMLASFKDMIARGTPTAVCLALSQFLAQSGRLKKLSDNVQAPILRILVSLFHLLLGHSHWLVVHHTLSAFHSFAETTSYSLAVEECVPVHLNSRVCDFLQRIPHLTSERPEMSEDLFWVRELRGRSERGRRLREGVKNNGCAAHAQQHLVTLKIQTLLETWSELCTLHLSLQDRQKLNELCTSIQACLNHLSTHSPNNTK